MQITIAVEQPPAQARLQLEEEGDVALARHFFTRHGCWEGLHCLDIKPMEVVVHSCEAVVVDVEVLPEIQLRPSRPIDRGANGVHFTVLHFDDARDVAWRR